MSLSATSIAGFLGDGWRTGCRIYWLLFRIAFPLLVIIRLLDEHFGLVARTGELMSPLMHWVGLPGEVGIVLATAIFMQIYAAILVMASLWTTLDLSVAQSTVLMTMILVMHSLPVEGRIVQKAGMSLSFALALRCFCAFALGALLHLLYDGRWLQDEARLSIAPLSADSGWGDWFAAQLRNWAIIFAVVQLLVLFNNLLRVTHAERLLIWIFSPLFKRMGIGETATTMTMVGLFLGLSYGGGLLIEHGKRRDISRRDILCALTLLCLCHSVIEDTLVALLVGAHYSGVLVGRLLFSLVFMIGFSFLIRRLSDRSLQFFTSNARRPGFSSPT